MLKTEPTNRLLVMPFFETHPKFDVQKFINDIESKWQLIPTKFDGDKSACSFFLNGEEIIIGHVEAPIPSKDIIEAATMNQNREYLPKNLQDISDHFIISVISNNSGYLDRLILFTKVVNSFISNSNATGVYNGQIKLLVSRNFYINTSSELLNNDIPVELWVYFGFSKIANQIRQFTLGLGQFGKPELQMAIEKMDLDQGYNLLYSISKYILSNNIEFQDQEVLSFGEQRFVASFLEKELTGEEYVVITPAKLR